MQLDRCIFGMLLSLGLHLPEGTATTAIAKRELQGLDASHANIRLVAGFDGAFWIEVRASL
jgi:hypothetical protein